MRGIASTQPAFFSYVDIESLIPVKYPLRAIKPLAMETLASMDGAFERLYVKEGRPPVSPEQLLLAHKQVKPLLSDDHFSVDGTLIEAWASHKSFRPKDAQDSGGDDYHGDKRRNDTHQSVTDPDARLYKKSAGKEAKLAYMGHALMENRHGLAVDGMTTRATGTAEREAAKALLAKRTKKGRRITVGGDKGYDVKADVRALRAMGVTPHIARNDARTKTGKRRASAIDGRTSRHAGYAISQVIRKRIECLFGYAKHAGTLRKTKHRGLESVGFDFLLNLAGYNLIRIPKLLAGTG